MGLKLLETARLAARPCLSRSMFHVLLLCPFDDQLMLHLHPWFVSTGNIAEKSRLAPGLHKTLSCHLNASYRLRNLYTHTHRHPYSQDFLAEAAATNPEIVRAQQHLPQSTNASQLMSKKLYRVDILSIDCIDVSYHVFGHRLRGNREVALIALSLNGLLLC